MIVNVTEKECQIINQINDITANYKKDKIRPLEAYMLYKNVYKELQLNSLDYSIKTHNIEAGGQKTEVELIDLVKRFMEFLILEMRTFHMD